MGAPFPLAGAGLLGDDDDGRAILADCRALGIDTAQLRTAPGRSTSYTDVMTVRGTRPAHVLPPPRGQRPARRRALRLRAGARSASSTSATSCSSTRSTLRAPTGPRAPCDVLRGARACGMADLDRLRQRGRRAIPRRGRAGPARGRRALRQRLRGGAARGDRPRPRRRASTAPPSRRRPARSSGLGVRRWAVVHFPEGACACSGAGRDRLAARGPRAAGDDRAAPPGPATRWPPASSSALHEGWPMARALELGVCAAATSLLHPNCSDSVARRRSAWPSAASTDSPPLP